MFLVPQPDDVMDLWGSGTSGRGQNIGMDSKAGGGDGGKNGVVVVEDTIEGCRWVELHDRPIDVFHFLSALYDGL